MRQGCKRNPKPVLKAIRNYRSAILDDSLQVVKNLFKQMQPLFDSGKDTDRHIFSSTENHASASGEVSYFDKETIFKAKKLLTEIKDGYNYWQDSEKFFEVLDSGAMTHDLFSRYDEFSELQKLMKAYEMTGIHLGFYLNSDS